MNSGILLSHISIVDNNSFNVFFIKIITQFAVVEYLLPVIYPGEHMLLIDFVHQGTGCLLRNFY